MRLELAERLLCPEAHAPTPLIVVARRTVDRDLITGFAGCPVCHLEARLDDGDLTFSGAASATNEETAQGPAAGARSGASDAPPELDRVIALLGLAEPGGAVLLSGHYAALAEALTLAVEVHVATLHPRGGPAGLLPGVGAVRGARERMPFLDATFRAAALDASLAPALAADVVRTMVIGGRLLAGAELALPAGVKQLARDDREWVGERVAVVELRRRGQ